MIEMSWVDEKGNEYYCSISEGIMLDTIKKTILLSICFSIISYFLPAMSSARLVVQTKVVSGNITHKYENHAVKLDNGKIYKPSREGLSIDLPVGEPVTLRIVEEADKIVFSSLPLD
jgi:hypothetical protein